MATIPLGGRFYRSDSLPVSAQECVNLRMGRVETTSVTKEVLYVTEGIVLATTAGENVTNRGGHEFKGKPYFVNGQDLYRIDRTVSTSGNVTYSSVKVNGAEPIPGTGRVIMADNGGDGDQLCIVVPELDNKFNAYIYTESGGLVAISDADFDGPVSTVNFVDGYFLFTKKNSQNFFVSELRDGLSYNALDFGSAEADTDNIVGSFIVNNEPYILGQRTIEGFQNIGGAGFPFQRVPGAVQRIGIRSRFAIASINDRVMFLGASENETASIYVTNGGRPEKASTIAIDNEISRYTDTQIENCFAFTYSFGGAQYIAFTFPEQRTFVFDFLSGEWHTRESRNVFEEAVEYRVSSVVAAYGVIMVADSLSTSIGVISKTTYTEYGEKVRRRFVTPQVDNEGMPFFLDALELWGEPGEGLTNGQGSDPTVLMSISRDGGKTFEGSIPRSFGKTGDYNHRTIWNSLGRFSRQGCFRFEVSDPIKWVFSKLEARFE